MQEILPDLATQTPLWLALLTVGVNAIVGALRASSDDEHHWDIVGLSTFAVLMGLGGGFIRDILLGNTPVESLRTPWYLVTVLVGIGLVLLFGRRISGAHQLVALLNSVALGLFAVTGTAYALRADLPIVSAVFVGVVSAVGGGVLVSVIKRRSARNFADQCAKCVMRRSNFAGFVSRELSGIRSHDANEHGCACEVAGFFATYVSTCAWAA